MLATPQILDDMDCFLPDNSATNRLANFFALFADSTRVRLLSALSLHPLCVTDLSEILSINQTTVSHQLRLLRDAGIVEYERNGKVLQYKIANNKINEVLLIGVESTTK